jgi:hypothetical protein
LFVSTVGELRKLDPEFKSFVNINVREDLTRLPTRVVKKGPVKENLRLNIGSLRESELKKLRTAARYNDKGRFVEASNMFFSCSTRLEKARLNFWAGVSNENEGEIMFNLSRRREDTELEEDYHLKGRAGFVKAAQNYGSEAETYDKNNVSFLSKHARNDQLWCQHLAESSF